MSGSVVKVVTVVTLTSEGGHTVQTHSKDTGIQVILTGISNPVIASACTIDPNFVSNCEYQVKGFGKVDIGTAVVANETMQGMILSDLNAQFVFIGEKNRFEKLKLTIYE
jgi:hypothetical protein